MSTSRHASPTPAPASPPTPADPVAHRTGTPTGDRPEPPDLPVQIVADAAGRLRLRLPWLVGSPARAVAVEEAVHRLRGVRAVQAFPRTGAVVVWHSNRCDREELLRAVRGAGLTSASAVATRPPWSAEVSNGDVLRMVLGGAALALLGFRRYGLRRPPALGSGSRLFATGVTVATGYPFFRGAVRSLAGGRGVGTDALVSAATIASLVLRENVVALTVLWLLNIGEYLQDLTLRRTRRAISDLLTGSADTIWIRSGHDTGDPIEVQVAVDDLEVGDLVVLHEQVALPVDGVVTEGGGLLDQAAVTGESLPVTVTVGDRVVAGSVLVRGRLVVQAYAVGSQTAIGRIIDRVEQAQQDRAPIQTVGETFSRRFVPLSCALAGLTRLAPRDVRRAMTMLLVACPCAVGLATPTAISAAIGAGARRGILIKGGSHLENASRVDAVVIDKTGTLTTGRPVVTNVVAFDPDWTPEQVLAYAASSEIHSRHPLGQAVIRSTEERHIAIPEHEECEVLLGMGMRTQADGRTLLLGSPELLAALEVTLDPAREWVERLRAQAETPLLLAVDARLVGLVSLTDTIRPEAAEVLAELRRRGVEEIVMLTGDHPRVAAATAQAVGISQWRAQVLPEDKQAVVAELKQRGRTVAMIGDGTNDAPALALADIGIAMGIAGTDVAVETADVALAGDDLTTVLELRGLSARTIATIRQNDGMAIAVNGLGLAVGALGALSPVLAAVLHNASSVAVVLNSGRLARERREPPVGDTRRLDETS